VHGQWLGRRSWLLGTIGRWNSRTVLALKNGEK
jgi:hypothetical protein